MKRPWMAMAVLLGLFLLALGGLRFLLAGLGLMTLALWGLAVLLFICAALLQDEEERGNTPPVIIIDPLTGMPDFEGYRPRESELPQWQPAAELLIQEAGAETAEEILADIMLAHERQE